MTKYVYLAGPMEDKPQAEINDWRTIARLALGRASGHLITITPARSEPETLYTPKASKEIFAKNLLDCKSCDLLLAYMPSFLTQDRGNYGTTMEVAWFAMMQKPIVLVSDNPKIINHPLFWHGCDWITDSLDDALDIVPRILGPYE